MKASLPVLVTLLGSCALVGCSPQDAASAAAPASAAIAAPTDDPCALVTDAEVRKSFPGAKSGKRDHSLDQYKIATCKWEATASTVVVQTYALKDSVENELRGRMLGSIDPLKPGAGAKVQYDTIAGLGDEAKVVVEKADAEQGILGDVAVLGMRRGERLAVLFTSALVDGDRAATVKALEALGRSAAPRL
jgi:hypothetical protein